MNESPYSLVHSPASLKTQYRKLFTSQEIDYQEVILANEFSEDLLRFHSATWKFTSGSYGARWSLSKAFVNTYLMLDGSRFTDRTDYEKTEFTEEVKNRDYRLMQSVITPRLFEEGRRGGYPEGSRFLADAHGLSDYQMDA